MNNGPVVEQPDSSQQEIKKHRIAEIRGTAEQQLQQQITTMTTYQNLINGAKTQAKRDLYKKKMLKLKPVILKLLTMVEQLKAVEDKKNA